MKDLARSCFYSSEDGLTLHYRDFAALEGSRTPAVCLAGLTRDSRDFERLGNALARLSATPRRVLAFDYRGRGLSDHDLDWRHYDLDTERTDLLKALADIGVDQAHFIGTSRGGLHILGLAATNRDLVRAAVFNDIGPVLEPEGLRRIKGYVGQPVTPQSFEDAIAILKLGGGRDFDGLDATSWRFFAETTFGTQESKLGLRYDPKIARTLDAFDLDKPLPDSWPLFDRLKDAPVLTIRGGNSDLLSDATLAAMGSRWAASDTLTVAGQGHAPLLADAVTIDRIDRFLANADGAFPPSDDTSRRTALSKP